jgi:hypothetical protein
MLAARWRWAPDTVTDFLRTLRGTHITVVSRTHAGTIYSVVGYPLSEQAYIPASHAQQDASQDAVSHAQQDARSHEIKKLRSEEVKKTPSWPARAAETMNAATGGLVSIPKLGKLLSPIVKSKGGFDVIESAWSRFCSSPEVQYGAGYFAEHYGKYNDGAPQLDRKASEARDQQLNRDLRVGDQIPF